MPELAFACPDCRGALSREGMRLLCHNGHEFAVRNGMYHLLPKSLTPLTASEAAYHAEGKTTWAEQNQIETLRNVHFHRSFLREIANRCTATSCLLEIGGGIGFDLNLFLQLKPDFETYVFSEVSQELVAYAAGEVKSDRVIYSALDAQRIPFAEGQFDCVFVVAALHHLPDASAGLQEMARVTKRGGFICCGIEPNRWWLSALKQSRWLLRKVLPEKDHSLADEQALGLRPRDYVDLGRANQLRLLWFEPVWFLCGFIHYGLELAYRLFRLQRRIRLPVIVERFVVQIDNILLRLPGIRNLSWHNSVIYQKL